MPVTSFVCLLALTSALVAFPPPATRTSTESSHEPTENTVPKCSTLVKVAARGSCVLFLVRLYKAYRMAFRGSLWFTANCASSERVETPSLSKIWLRWNFIVSSVNLMYWAISRSL